MINDDIQRWNPDYQQGLDAGQVETRKRQGLQNIQPDHMTKTIWQIIRDNLFTLFNAFNFAVAICLLLVGAYRDLMYLVVIVANIVIGIIQEIRSKKMVEKLSIISAPKALIVRQGEEREVAVEELVLDDICILQAGRQVCADCKVVYGQIEVNEALLTGESDSILKKPGDTLLSGSFVVSGKSWCQVCHVGTDNYAAQITQEAKKHKKFHSGLMDALNKVVKFTSMFIIPIGVLLFLKSYFLSDLPLDEAVSSTSAALLGMLPKGLVLLTSVSLAVGVIKLARQKTLVQELFCIETLARVDTICLDKTGTITQGDMQVIDTIPLETDNLPVSLEELLGGFVRNQEDNNATFMALKKRFPGGQDLKAVGRTSFSSERKWSSVVLKDIGTVVIGAPEIVAKNMEFTLPDRAQQMVAEGTRLLLVCCSEQQVEQALPEQMHPIALICLKDPVRHDAKKTLEFFEKQGIQFKLISGDNPTAVAAIAKQVGLKGADQYIDMSTVEDEAALQEAAKTYRVFGRVSPLQKRQLIQAFHNQGHTVAMTGDGINDVLALRESDCSIAMGAGSDAARQVSQLVLLNSQFSALPSVLMEGRRVVNNITRAASLFLMKTVFSFLLSFITLFTPIHYPFVPVQLSLIGVLFEGVPSFILALEPNKNPIRGEFLPTVLLRAIPSGVVVVINIILIWVMADVLDLEDVELVTLNVYMTAVTALFLLIRICRPFNVLRAALCIVMASAFFIGAYFFRDFLNMGILSTEGRLLFAGLVVLCYPMVWLCGKLLQKIKFFQKALNILQ